MRLVAHIQGVAMTQACVRKNPFTDAIAGVHCGLAPVMLLCLFTPIHTGREFMFYFLLGSAFSLALMHLTHDLRLNFALPYFVTFAFFLGMMKKIYTQDLSIALSAAAVSSLLYIGLHLCEIRWRKYNP